MTYALGSRVSFTHVLKREPLYFPEKTEAGRNQKHWLPKPQEGKGILVGFRTKSNGYAETISDYGEYGEGGFYTIWSPVGYVKCAIVATSLYRNTVFVPLDALKEDA